MKKLFTILLILLIVAPAYADGFDNYVVRYNENATFYGVPFLTNEFDNGMFYCEETDMGVCFIYNETKGEIYGMCQPLSVTKADEFLMAAACLVDTMNTNHEKEELYGYLFGVYLNCVNGNEGTYFYTFEDGFAIGVKKENSIYTAIAGMV